MAVATVARKPQQAAHRTIRDVLEYTLANPTSKALRVDEKNGIVFGVKILGRVSRNGHKYSRKGITAAKSLYEGAGVNLNHPADRVATAERSIHDRFGELRNVQEKEDGLYADHHYLKEHPFVPQYLGIVRDFPRQAGFSHNAAVTESIQDGQVVFATIDRVRSVDLVCNPATTRGVFESEKGRGQEPEGRRQHPNHVEIEEASDNAPDPDDTEEASPAADAVSKTFVAALKALVESDASPEEKLKRIAKLLADHDDSVVAVESCGHERRRPIRLVRAFAFHVRNALESLNTGKPFSTTAPPVVITRDGLESYVETVKRRGAPGVRVGRPVVAPMTSAELAAYAKKVNGGRPRGMPAKNLTY